MVLRWRGDRSEALLRDSSRSRLARTRDQIKSSTEAYTSRHHRSLTLHVDDIRLTDVGLQARSGRETVLQIETVGCRKDSGEESTATMGVHAKAPSSSSGQYHLGSSKETGKQVELEFEIPGGFPYLISG